MVVSRALAITLLKAERHRLKVWHLGCNRAFSWSSWNAAAPVVLFRRNASSTPPMLQVPKESAMEESEERPQKKSILGLDFLSKLFGRGSEEGVAASEAHSGAVGVSSTQEQSVEQTPQAAELEEVDQVQNEKYTLESAGEVEGTLAESSAEVVPSEQVLDERWNSTTPEENVSLEAASTIEALSTVEAAPVTEGSPVMEAAAVTEGSPTVEAAPVGEGSPNVEVAPTAEALEGEETLSTVEEFIESLPPLPAAMSLPEQATQHQAPVDKATTEKPKASTTEKKDASKPKTTLEASTSPAPALAKATAKPGSKPAKKPNPTKASTAVAADATPMYDFLRQKLRDPASDSEAKPAEPPKPPPLKLSLSSAQKTNAAINTLLDSVEKGTKSAPAPLPIFDALNAKQEDTTETATPSLRLSLSPAAEKSPMDAQTLGIEMNMRLTDGKLAEACSLFEDWRSSINPLTLEPNKPDRTLYNLYMQAKLKVGAEYSELSEVVSEMEEAGLPRDLAGYNILIRALFRRKDSAKAEAILERMEKEEPQAQPDADSYNLVVVLCALDRKVNAAMKHMKTMIDKGFEPSRTTVNEVLLASARSHQTQMAASLLKDLKASGKFPLPMLNTCAELLMSASEVDDNECARLALASISERPMAKFGPKMILDEGTMICVLGTAARTGDSVLCNKAWESVCSHTRGLGKVPSPESFLARIHALTSTADLSAAFKAAWEFEVCHAKKGETDAEMFSPFTSLKSLAAACSRGGAAALDAAYYKVEDSHSKKQGVALASLNCIIMGCSNLWDSERAFQTFEAIENVFGLRPDLHSCNALLHALGRTKMTEDALKVFEYIKEAGFKPNSWTYMLLAEAHVVNRDANAALDIMQTMIDAGHRPLRQTMNRVWTRCKQYEDTEGLERLKKLESNLNYRTFYFANNRRKLLLDMIRSSA